MIFTVNKVLLGMSRTLLQKPRHLEAAKNCILHKMCRIAKNLFNQAIFNNSPKCIFNDDQFFVCEENYHTLKSSENCKILNLNMGQQRLNKLKVFLSLSQLTVNTSKKISARLRRFVFLVAYPKMWLPP